MHPLNPVFAAKSLWRNRELVFAMGGREVAGRYRGSVLGLFWSFFNPLLMLGVYTFVFSTVFQSRWAGAEKGGFALLVFSGMIVHSLFAECVNRSPALMLSNVNLIKKVVFPLEILPWVGLVSAAFHGAVSLLVLLGFEAVVTGRVPATALELPLLLIPLFLMTMGFSWLLAALGVYLRDVAQTIGIITQVLLFASPVLYPASAVPESLRPWLYANPLTFIIEQVRGVLFQGISIDWGGWLVYCVISALVASLGFAFFQKARRGFSDVL